MGYSLSEETLIMTSGKLLEAGASRKGGNI